MKSGSLSVFAGNLIVGDGKVRENVHVGIENGIIKEVSDKPLGDRYEEEVDYSGKYVMPGLIDAHVHIRYDPYGDPEKRSHEYQALRGA